MPEVCPVCGHPAEMPDLIHSRAGTAYHISCHKEARHRAMMRAEIERARRNEDLLARIEAQAKTKPETAMRALLAIIPDSPDWPVIIENAFPVMGTQIRDHHRAAQRKVIDYVLGYTEGEARDLALCAVHVLCDCGFRRSTNHAFCDWLEDLAVRGVIY